MRVFTETPRISATPAVSQTTGPAAAFSPVVRSPRLGHLRERGCGEELGRRRLARKTSRPSGVVKTRRDDFRTE